MSLTPQPQPQPQPQPVRRRSWWWRRTKQTSSYHETPNKTGPCAACTEAHTNASLKAHRARSERSSAVSVVDSTDSIWSKPWASSSPVHPLPEKYPPTPLKPSVSRSTLWPDKLMAGLGKLVGKSHSEETKESSPI